MSCPIRHSASAGFLATALVVLGGGSARADDTDQAIHAQAIHAQAIHAQAIQKIVHLDQVIHIMALEFNGASRDADSVASRRVVDAQALLARDRTDEAATILLDVVTKWPRTRAAEDARFLLADAFFQLRDFLSARIFYEEALSGFTGTRREQQAVGRLIEIALRTGDFEPVDGYFHMLAKVPTRALDPCVPYVKAKLAYARGNLGDAARIFASIPLASPYSWRARYFIGTIRVKSGDLKGAAAAYEAMLRSAAPDDGAREIQDLARLALGRICARQERLACARTHYQAVEPKSKVFADALYELGFTYVRSQDFDRALGTFDRLLHVDPDGAQVFEVKVLVGNLHLRRGDLAAASRSFVSARDELGPSYGKLRDVVARIQIDQGFLDTLAKRGLGEIALGAFVSPAGRNWVRADPEVERLLTLSSNIAGTPLGVADVKNTLRRIEGVLANPDSQMLFPDLTRVRSALTEVSAELLALRGPFLSRARLLEQPHLLESEARLLDRNAAERTEIERQLTARLTLNSAPGGSVGVSRDHGGQNQDDDRDVAPRIVSSQVGPTEKGQEPLGPLLVMAWQLPDRSSRLETAGARIETSGARPATALPSTARAQSASARLEQLLGQEHLLHQAARTKMDPSERGELDRHLDVLARADATVAQLVVLDARIDSEIDLRLAATREFIAARRQEVAAEDDKLAIVLGDAGILGGSFVQLVCTRLADRLYDLVIRADAGLIDVAWVGKERSVAVVHAVQARKNGELEVLRETMKSQEAALARRFSAESEWAKWARLRLGMPVPILRDH